MPLDQRFVYDGPVHKLLGSKESDAALLEYVIEGEGCLSECAGTLKLVKFDNLKAREESGLDISEAVDETDVELAFVTPKLVEELSFSLQCVTGRERQEESALTGECDIAILGIWTGVEIDRGVLLKG